jgi:serine/threonine protein kinase
MLHLIESPIIENLEVLNTGAYGQVYKLIHEGTFWAMKKAITPDSFCPIFEKDLNVKGCCHINCRKDALSKFSFWSCQSGPLSPSGPSGQPDSRKESCFLQTCERCNSDSINQLANPTPDTTFCHDIRRHPLMKEASILKFLSEKSSSSHFPSVLGLVRNQNQTLFVFELSDMDLEKFMERNASSLHVDFKRELTNQLFQALEFIHRCGFVHNDMKPKNILIKGRQLKITDFGISMKDSIKHAREINTVDHRPPECFLTKNLTYRKNLHVRSPDLWATGLITAFIWTGKYLFSIPHGLKSEKIFMLLQIFMFWKHSGSVIFDTKSKEFNSLLDQYRNLILVPDGYCYFVYDENKKKDSIQEDYYESMDMTVCKPFFDLFVKPQFSGKTYGELHKFVQSTLKTSHQENSVAINYLKSSKLFDEVVYFTNNVNSEGIFDLPKETSKRNIDDVMEIGTSKVFMSFMKNMKQSYYLLFEKTSENKLYFDVVMRLLSFDRFHICQASDILRMLRVEKIQKEYVPTTDEFENHYQTSLLQLHYQVIFLPLSFFFFCGIDLYFIFYTESHHE